MDKDRLVWHDSRVNAVFLTTGCVSACNLITPAPGVNNSAAAKKLLLFPIEGLFQDGLDFFGVKFKVAQAAGQLNNGVVTYSTKKEGHNIYPSSSGKLLYFHCTALIIFARQVLWAAQRKEDFSKSRLLVLQRQVASLLPCHLEMMVGLHAFHSHFDFDLNVKFLFTMRLMDSHSMRQVSPIFVPYLCIARVFTICPHMRSSRWVTQSRLSVHQTRRLPTRLFYSIFCL